MQKQQKKQQKPVLALQTGALTLPVVRDGTQMGTLTLRPDDTAFLSKFYSLLGTVEEQRAALAARLETNAAPQLVLRALEETCCCLRTEIDTVFGVGTSALVFGEGCSLALMQQFFAGVAEALRGARADKLAEYTAPDAGAVLQ